MKRTININSIVILLVLASLSIKSYSQTKFIWGKQFGSEKEEYVMNHLIDNKGNIYIAGKTAGTITGKNAGENDGFIMKTDSSGKSIWAKQFGSSGNEDIQWSAIDNKEFIYITGSTTGDLSGKNQGKEDIFIVKYTPLGQMEWSKQFGTDSMDVAKGVFTDNMGYIYITGFTSGKLGKTSLGKNDGFIMKLDGNGNQVFIIQFGTTGDDLCNSLTCGTGSADIYVCGTTWGDLGGKNKGFVDGFTGQFSDKGTLVRYTQFGTDGFDVPMIIKTDEKDNLYVGGMTSGDFGGKQIGEGDGFFLKIGNNGEILWNKQFGTPKNDGVRSIDLNPGATDNILISGVQNLPPAQAFVRMYKKDGTLVWDKGFLAEGKNGDMSGKCVKIDDTGRITHSGLTMSNLFGNLSGETDFYLVKLRLEK
jgi:hypothetical protein